MPILHPHSLEFISRSPEQTRRAGMRLGAVLRPGDLICLVGDLGAGKTTFVQGLASGWGSLDQASSPTFVLVNVYRRPDGGRLYHLDTYRLSGPAEALDLDLDDLLDTGPLAVEWAERISTVLPAERLTATLTWAGDEQRDLIFQAEGPRYIELLKNLRRQLFGLG
jgi:tRNA threonylcarbamoyladenosine biosynthesis protein TsaE